MSGHLILIQVEPPEIRVAELREGVLFDLEVDRAGRVLGDIYKGRVENVLPGMDGAFVDIGLKRNALIYVGDIESDQSPAISKNQSISQLVQSGDEIIVQIARPPVGSKGARVTTRLSLPGRFVILVTHTDNVGVSKRIESDKERQRLRRIADRLRPLGYGLILRTEAQGATEQELERDIKFLHGQLQSIYERSRQSVAPAMLHRESGLLERVVRDRLNEQVAAVYVDSEEAFHAFQNMARLLAPQMVESVHLHNAPVDLFEKFGVAGAVQLATERRVELPSGGSIVIDETEALIAVDVNTGRFTGKNQLADTVLQTNLQAVEEIARQLRVRNLGGVIVIDFIDMPRTRDRIRVLNNLEAALRHDRTRTKIVNISPSGLVEMTRRREGYSLRQLLHDNCFYCGGDGVVERASTVAINARRRMRNLGRQREATREASQDAMQDAMLIEVTLHPEVACALLGPNEEYLHDLEQTANLRVLLRANPALHIEASEVVSPAGGEAAEFESGKRYYLTEPSKTYPTQHPRFIVLKNRLVKLVKLSADLSSGEQLPPCVIEISDVNNWFLSGKVVVQDAQPDGV